VIRGVPGDEIPPLRRVVSRDDVLAYARASGDHNPLHQDDDVARAAGFPGILAHGMFTMGHLAACLVGWAGQPARVIGLTAHFRSPVFVDDEIIAGGRVLTVDDGIATLETWVTVERDGRTEWPIKRGSARIRLD
jgi:acyl dehydratase